MKSTTIGYSKYVMSDASRKNALPFMQKKTKEFYNVKRTYAMPLTSRHPKN